MDFKAEIKGTTIGKPGTRLCQKNCNSGKTVPDIQVCYFWNNILSQNCSCNLKFSRQLKKIILSICERFNEEIHMWEGYTS